MKELEIVRSPAVISAVFHIVGCLEKNGMNSRAL